MGKRKGPAWDFFKEKGCGVICKYCCKEYKHANVNKMSNHIKKCFKTPADLKKVLNSNICATAVFKSFSTSTPQKMSVLEPLEIDTSFETEPEPGPSASSNEHNRLASRNSNLSSSSSSEVWGLQQCGQSKTLLQSSTSQSSQQSQLLSFVDHMDTQENERLNQYLAKAIFVSGSPLALVEHPLWIDFFKKIRPSYVLPSRYRLASTYLDAQYTEMQTEVSKQLQDSKDLHLQCDGWSNLNNESIINFVVSKPDPLFVDFVMTKDNRHNARYLAELIEKILIKYGPEKFLVIIADNAANMKAALNIVKEKYPNIVPLGCLAHLLHLLCSDILRCTSVKSFMATVIDIVKTIKNSHILKALFDQISAEKKKFKDRVTLKLPGKTRWGSHLFCIKSLLANKVVLQTLAVSEQAELSTEMKRRLLDDCVFWVRVQKMVDILNPIVHLITAFESNQPQIHKVFSKFNDLEKTLIVQLPLSPLQKAEEKNVLKKFKKRRDFGLGEIHLAADLLNPAAQGSSLKPLELLDAVSFVCDVGRKMGVSIPKIKENIADYRDKQGIWGKEFVWEGIDELSPVLWWRGLRGTCELADVAIRILGAPVTSAATERTFSTFSWVHSKKRNRLNSQRAAKLTYLSCNWKLLNCKSKPNKRKRSCEEQQDKGEKPSENKIPEDEDKDESDVEDEVKDNSDFEDEDKDESDFEDEDKDESDVEEEDRDESDAGVTDEDENGVEDSVV